MECKGISLTIVPSFFLVLIETSWNVKAGDIVFVVAALNSINRNIVECKDGKGRK